MSLGTGARRGIVLTSGIIRRVTTGNQSLYRGTLARSGLERQLTPSVMYMSVMSKNLHNQSQSLFPESSSSGLMDSTNTIQEVAIQSSALTTEVVESAYRATDVLANLPSGNLGTMGSIFSGAPPVQAAQDLFIQLHDLPGSVIN